MPKKGISGLKQKKSDFCVRPWSSLTKPEEKQNSATIMISVDEKGTVFMVKLKLQGESFEKRF